MMRCRPGTVSAMCAVPHLRCTASALHRRAGRIAHNARTRGPLLSSLSPLAGRGWPPEASRVRGFCALLAHAARASHARAVSASTRAMCSAARSTSASRNARQLLRRRHALVERLDRGAEAGPCGAPASTATSARSTHRHRRRSRACACRRWRRRRASSRRRLLTHALHASRRPAAAAAPEPVVACVAVWSCVLLLRCASRADHSQFGSPRLEKKRGEQSADRRWCGSAAPVTRLAVGSISGSPEITGP